MKKHLFLYISLFAIVQSYLFCVEYDVHEIPIENWQLDKTRITTDGTVITIKNHRGWENGNKDLFSRFENRPKIFFFHPKLGTQLIPTPKYFFEILTSLPPGHGQYRCNWGAYDFISNRAGNIIVIGIKIRNNLNYSSSYNLFVWKKGKGFSLLQDVSDSNLLHLSNDGLLLTQDYALDTSTMTMLKFGDLNLGGKALASDREGWILLRRTNNELYFVEFSTQNIVEVKSSDGLRNLSVEQLCVKALDNKGYYYLSDDQGDIIFKIDPINYQFEWNEIGPECSLRSLCSYTENPEHILNPLLQQNNNSSFSGEYVLTVLCHHVFSIDGTYNPECHYKIFASDPEGGIAGAIIEPVLDDNRGDEWTGPSYSERRRAFAYTSKNEFIGLEEYNESICQSDGTSGVWPQAINSSGWIVLRGSKLLLLIPKAQVNLTHTKE